MSRWIATASKVMLVSSDVSLRQSLQKTVMATSSAYLGLPTPRLLPWAFCHSSSRLCVPVCIWFSAKYAKRDLFERQHYVLWPHGPVSQLEGVMLRHRVTTGKCSEAAPILLSRT